MRATLYTTFQNIAEFWNVSTRPEQRNGLGLSPAEVRANLKWIEQEFELLTEGPQTYRQWLRLVTDFHVSGRQVHDARLAAHMLAHDIPYLLTANIRDFQRYPFIQLLDPEQWES